MIILQEDSGSMKERRSGSGDPMSGKSGSEIVIHRITGDGPKELLLAPLWAGRKREVLNLLHHKMKECGSFQGKAL